jgi:hypothetical protein
MYDRTLVLDILGQIDGALQKVCDRSGRIANADDLTATPEGEERLDGLCMLFIAIGESLKNLGYRRVHALLTSGRVEIRVVPKDRVFVHGKAGVIEAADGSKTWFLASINETKSAIADNYEILCEDPSAEGVAWVEGEFDTLWADAFPPPEAIVDEVRRVAERVDIRFEGHRRLLAPLFQPVRLERTRSNCRL